MVGDGHRGMAKGGSRGSPLLPHMANPTMSKSYGTQGPGTTGREFTPALLGEACT